MLCLEGNEFFKDYLYAGSCMGRTRSVGLITGGPCRACNASAYQAPSELPVCS